VDLTEDSASGSDEAEEEGKEDNGDDDDDDNDSTTEGSDGEDPPWSSTSSRWPSEVVFGRLLDLYTFAITCEVTDLKVATILAWQRLSRKKSIGLCPTVIRHVCLAAPATSGLVRYLAGSLSYCIDVEDVTE
jgi:hypothetical protein